MSRLDRIKKLGLTEDDFKPKKHLTEERISELEDALIELAELIVGDDEDGEDLR